LPTDQKLVSPVAARRARSFSDYVALGVATCGVGYFPIAPGTWGSAVGVLLYLLTRQAIALASAHGAGPVLQAAQTTLVLLALFGLTIAGIWAGSRAEKLMGRKDPGAVVIDEVVGQLVAFLAVPFNSRWWVIVTGFFAFRMFDIWKPYPIRKLEALESGLGIMADDVLAGAYAGILLSTIVTAASTLSNLS
jgi:phosphatidylglycerophosphatase A